MRNHSDMAAFLRLYPTLSLSLSSAAEIFYTVEVFLFIYLFCSRLCEDSVYSSPPASSWGWLRTRHVMTQMYIMLNLWKKQGVNLKKTKAPTFGLGCQKAARSAAQFSVEWGHARWYFCCFRSVSSQAGATLLWRKTFCACVLAMISSAPAQRYLRVFNTLF